MNLNMTTILLLLALGLLAGILSSMVGIGGGIVIVPARRRGGMEPRQRASACRNCGSRTGGAPRRNVGGSQYGFLAEVGERLV